MLLISHLIFIEWHDERREVESQRLFSGLFTHSLSFSHSLSHSAPCFACQINIQLVFGFAPTVEKKSLNSVAPITSASTRFSISIITGSTYILGHVQVSCQTFQALALSGNSRPGHSGTEIGWVGIPIDHSPTGSWERVLGIWWRWNRQHMRIADY